MSAGRVLLVHAAVPGRTRLRVPGLRHDEVLALADRAYVLDRGQITHEGPAEPLLSDLDYRKQVLWL